MPNKWILTSLIILFFSPYAFTNLYNKGKKYYKNGNTTKAKKAFYDYYKKHPRSYNAPFALYLYAKLKSDPNNIINLLYTIRNNYPNFPKLDKLLEELADLYYLKNDYNKSYKLYKELFKRFHKSSARPKAAYYLAKILILNKKYKKARNFLMAISNKAKNFNQIVFLIAQSYQYEKNFYKAIKYYNKIKPRNTNLKTKVLYNLGLCYLKLKLLNKSYGYFVLIIKKYPNSFETTAVKKLLKKLFFKNNNGYKLKSLSNIYYLQIGVFSNKNYAINIKNRISKLTNNCFLLTKTTFTKTTYKVIVGFFQTKKKAYKLKSYLTKKGSNALVKKMTVILPAVT